MKTAEEIYLETLNAYVKTTARKADLPIIGEYNQDTEKIWVFGDIHGCYNHLKLLLSVIDYKGEGKLIFLGDYVDRGKYSFEVIETIKDLQKKYGNDKVIALLGNHEDSLLDAYETNIYTDEQRGTLKSYKKNNANLDVEWLESLPLYHIDGDYFFVHAGVNSYLPLEKQDRHDLLWIREKFYLSPKQFEKRIIFGHTPILLIYPRSVNRVNYVGDNIAMDTCCFATGKLSCLELPTYTIYETQKEVYFYDKE